jgi:hypothetical protein
MSQPEPHIAHEAPSQPCAYPDKRHASHYEQHEQEMDDEYDIGEKHEVTRSRPYIHRGVENRTSAVAGLIRYKGKDSNGVLRKKNAHLAQKASATEFFPQKK